MDIDSAQTDWKVVSSFQKNGWNDVRTKFQHNPKVVLTLLRQQLKYIRTLFKGPKKSLNESLTPCKCRFFLKKRCSNNIKAFRSTFDFFKTSSKRHQYNVASAFKCRFNAVNSIETPYKCHPNAVQRNSNVIWTPFRRYFNKTKSPSRRCSN
jgi:hypothetical protein